MKRADISKIKLGRTGLDVSRIVYGGIISMNEKQQDSDRFVDYAVSHGVNYFDVAPGYGNAQEILGNSLKNKRKGILLACKTGEFDIELGKAQFYESLKLLHTDYFDVFQLHGLTTKEQLDKAFGAQGVMNFLVSAKQEGLIRNLGFSAHSEAVALKALSLYDFDTVLFPFNWSMNLSMNAGNELIREAKKRDMGILALKVLAERALADGESQKYPKSWYKPIDLSETEFVSAAVNYSLSLGIHTIVPPGYFEYLRFLVEKYESFSDPSLLKVSTEYLMSKVNTKENEILPHILEFN